MAKVAGRGRASAEEPAPRATGRGPLPLYRMPGHLVRRLQQVSVSLFLERMEAAGEDLTPVQYAAMRAIRHYPNIDQATLAGAIAYDRATIGGVIDRLEAKGYVRRAVSRRDRRVRQLALEPAGAALLDRVEQPVLDVQARILEPLNERERTALLRLLVRLAAAHNERSRAPLRPPAEPAQTER